ncbi:hypothetical protein DF3PA_10089 [Candidatus Defluviicoccus seviourii]|uniref:Uncharacterized protein n=1 Tax=Candidatus Defluviicoccus seviourii TaxID=2565273 RepID=A0A564W926_9PROT|nr:hypothetical protein DF3PA_10089 [Candidatus Defluviicoccus seviourii]
MRVGLGRGLQWRRGELRRHQWQGRGKDTLFLVRQGSSRRYNRPLFVGRRFVCLTRGGFT